MLSGPTRIWILVAFDGGTVDLCSRRMKNDSAPSSPRRVRLRPARPEDLSWMALAASDPVAVGEHNWGGEPRCRAEVEDELRAAFEKDGLVGTGGGSLLVELENGTRIGTVSWRTEQWGPSRDSRCPAFGIALLPEFRGRGYGTEAQRQLVDYLFENTSAHRVQSDTAVDNPAEQRSLRKIGMLEEGTVRQAEFRDGTYHDHTLFSILRPEWEAQRSANLD